MMVNEVTLDILNKGFFYVAGRDRCLRPIVVCNPNIPFSMSPVPTGPEVIAGLVAALAYNNTIM